MGQFKLPHGGRVVPNMQPNPDQMKAAIEEARRHLQTQKEVADLLGEKILAKQQQRKYSAELAMVRINGVQATIDGLSGSVSAITIEKLNAEIAARRKLRRADARFAAAEIAHMTYEHEGLIKAIELNEAQIEKAANPSPIVGARPNLVTG